MVTYPSARARRPPCCESPLVWETRRDSRTPWVERRNTTYYIVSGTAYLAPCGARPTNRPPPGKGGLLLVPAVRRPPKSRPDALWSLWRSLVAHRPTVTTRRTVGAGGPWLAERNAGLKAADARTFAIVRGTACFVGLHTQHMALCSETSGDPCPLWPQGVESRVAARAHGIEMPSDGGKPDTLVWIRALGPARSFEYARWSLRSRHRQLRGGTLPYLSVVLLMRALRARAPQSADCDARVYARAGDRALRQGGDQPRRGSARRQPTHV